VGAVPFRVFCCHLASRTRIGCSLPDLGKSIIFRAKAKFFGQKPAAKNEKKLKNTLFHF